MYALFILCARDGYAHGTSKSYADWAIEASRAEMRVSFAPHDFAQAIPALDADRNQKITREELELHRDEILRRALAATKLEVSGARSAPAQACTASAERLTPIGDPVEEVQIAATYTCEEAIGFVRLNTRYLPELEPPHVSVATVTAGEVTAQHIFTIDAQQMELELEPPTMAAILGDHFKRGLSSTADAALVLCLGVLCFLAGWKGAPPIAGTFAAGLIAAALLPLPPIPYLLAPAVAAAGIECLLVRPSILRRAAIALVLGVALGLGAPPASATMKLAYLFGALAPALVVTAAAALLNSYKTRLYERAVGVASLAASIALLVLALR